MKLYYLNYVEKMLSAGLKENMSKILMILASGYGKEVNFFPLLC